VAIAPLRHTSARNTISASITPKAPRAGTSLGARCPRIYDEPSTLSAPHLGRFPRLKGTIDSTAVSPLPAAEEPTWSSGSSRSPGADVSGTSSKKRHAPCGSPTPELGTRRQPTAEGSGSVKVGPCSGLRRMTPTCGATPGASSRRPPDTTRIGSAHRDRHGYLLVRRGVRECTLVTQVNLMTCSLTRRVAFRLLV